MSCPHPRIYQQMCIECGVYISKKMRAAALLAKKKASAEKPPASTVVKEIKK